MKWSVRTWLSLVTFGVIVLLLYATRDELFQAWELLKKVDWRILVLMLPLTFLNYYAVGEMFFSYLRRQGRLHETSVLDQLRVSLEVNFVNHALPSGGASGASYATWRLVQLGFSPGKAAMAQVIRFAAGFAAFAALLLVAVLAITADGEINRVVILISSGLISLMIATVAASMYFLTNKRRIDQAAHIIAGTVNALARWVTFGRRVHVVRIGAVNDLLTEVHEDVLALRHDPSALLRPIIWGLVFIASDVLLFFVAFWALGAIVNPASILLAYGMATIAGFLVVTPGGSGAYEALMVGFLAFAGLNQGTAVAGVVLARVIILLVILVVGYVSYQHALLKYGKENRP